MTITDTAAEWEAALDAAPDDWDLRLVYSDWLLETQTDAECPECGSNSPARHYFEFCDTCKRFGTGRIPAEVLAAGQRWQAENEKRAWIDASGLFPVRWFSESRRPKRIGPSKGPHNLPDDLVGIFANRGENFSELSGFKHYWEGQTRQAAELALAVALWKLNKEKW